MPDLQRIKEQFGVFGTNPLWENALETAVKVAPSDLPVLIYGETGAGKDVFPQIIHKYSNRRTGKFFALNCGGIPESTIDSELFGHEKGAFTGAIEMRKGYFEEANGGTLFLDEIGELPLTTQAKLLRVLQNGEFIRMGSSKTLKTDVRIIAATNKNLERLVAHGKFREDLYYRINSITITIPSLRERKDDIVRLFNGFAYERASLGQIPMFKLSPEAQKFIENYRWPGNVRQLKSVAESLCVLKGGGILTVSDIESILPKENNSVAIYSPETTGDSFTRDEKEAILKMMRHLYEEVESLKKVVSGMQGGEIAPVALTRRPMPQEEPEEDIQEQFSAPSQPTPEPEPVHDEDLSIESAEKDRIQRALAKHGGNREAAAAELGISVRTLYRKLKTQ